ncbi:acyl-CoA thioesterase [Tritonibacter mobilis]|nr:acyl-CoA thioesterase [Tritonibacter mobilis]
MDTYQHVNNLNFMKYMQSARVQFWEVLGLAKRYAETKEGPMLVSSKCDFKHPLFYPGNVRIKSNIEYIKNSSFGLRHTLYNDENTLCATGYDVAVCFDFTKNKTFMIPEDLRKIMSKYLV